MTEGSIILQALNLFITDEGNKLGQRHEGHNRCLHFHKLGDISNVYITVCRECSVKTEKATNQ